ncbi:MAG: Bifunctional transcriptional activator/DNA repair enzyme Ada [Bryobacteraceae bacterium]|nr:Bifunctional transcriptional activator/DNA repair enzyme Ada [Bryobacteraceae bacterium]
MSINAERCWDAVLRRDAAEDGRFIVGVITTGIYCKPSCPSRRPLRKNVRFYTSPQEAERDGLRPCLRCCPLSADDPAVARIRALCAYIEEHSGESVTLEDLGHRGGLSPYHLQRTFKSVVGVTPKQYLNACRMGSFKEQLRAGKSVTEAIYEAGYGSSSRLYERSGASLGMKPREYRNGADRLAIRYAVHQTGAGLMLVAATGRGVCAVEFGDSPEELERSLREEYPAAEITAIHPPYAEPFRQWLADLSRQVNGAQPARQLPLDVRVSAFRAKVYEQLRAIPAGETRSYSEVAAAIGRPSATRAVARACATNPVAVTVPCHRVVRRNGDMGGYRWGIDRKRKLLDAEAAMLKR